MLFMLCILRPDLAGPVKLEARHAAPFRAGEFRFRF
jgi:hypothetical protein